MALATAGIAKARWVSSRLLLWGGVGGTLSGLLIASLAGSIPALHLGKDAGSGHARVNSRLGLGFAVLLRFTNDEVVAATATPLILTLGVCEIHFLHNGAFLRLEQTRKGSCAERAFAWWRRTYDKAQYSRR